MEHKKKYGIPEFQDGFSIARIKADDAINSGNIDEFINYSLESVKIAVKELNALRQLTGFDDRKILYEQRRRETFIVSRLIKIKYSQRTGVFGTATTRHDLAKRIRECLSDYDASGHVNKLVSEKVKSKIASNNDSGLSTILKNDEGGRIECKKSFSLKEPVAKTISSFANTDGGTIYIGIAEVRDITEGDGSDYIINNFYAVGVDDIDTNRQRLMKFITENTDIDMACLKVGLLKFKTKLIVSIKVPPVYKRIGKIIFFENEAYKRVDNYNQKLSSREVGDLIKSTYSEPIKGQIIDPQYNDTKALKEAVKKLKGKIHDLSVNEIDIKATVDLICIKMIEAVQNGEDDLFRTYLKCLHDCYLLGYDIYGRTRLTDKFNPVDLWYEILLRLPIIGGACIEHKRYDLAKNIVLINAGGGDVQKYSNWYRHIFTMSARANCIQQETNSSHRSFLSLTTDIFINDMQYKNILNWDNDEGRVYIVSFDYLAAMLILDSAQNTSPNKYYPSFANYDKDKVMQMLIDILLNDETRNKLFKSSPENLAYILCKMDIHAHSESNFFWQDGYWSPALCKFIEAAKPFKE